MIENTPLNDYAFRGRELSDMNFVDFCVFTTHKKANVGNVQSPQPLSSGSNLAPRVFYRTEHPLSTSHFRQLCSYPSKYLPCFIGAGFASPDVPSERQLYLASMLILFRPWISWDDVIAWSENWEASFLDFIDNCSPFIRSCIHNTQLCRQARDAADAVAADNCDQDVLSASLVPFVDPVTEESDLEDALLSLLLPAPHTERPEVARWADDGLHTGAKAGLILPSDALACPGVLTNDGVNMDSALLGTWLSEMESITEAVVLNEAVIPNASSSYVIPDYDPSAQSASNFNAELPSIHEIREPLNAEQRLAFDIVHEHLLRTLDSTQPRPPQLLFKVLGAPGTGKSRLIEAITSMFATLNVLQKLHLSAHQGSAASIIGGTTIFSFLALKVESKKSKKSSNPGKLDGQDEKLSPKIRDALVQRTQHIEYLGIDEISQVNSSFALASLRPHNRYRGRLCHVCKNVATHGNRQDKWRWSSFRWCECADLW